MNSTKTAQPTLAEALTTLIRAGATVTIAVPGYTEAASTSGSPLGEEVDGFHRRRALRKVAKTRVAVEAADPAKRKARSSAWLALGHKERARLIRSTPKSQIAKQYKCSPSAVYAYARAHNIE